MKSLVQPDEVAVFYPDPDELAKEVIKTNKEIEQSFCDTPLTVGDFKTVTQPAHKMPIMVCSGINLSNNGRVLK
ncbi:hypothetical protein ACH3O9_11170 [Leeuwenhoekiella sp. A16]|uniref:hypothetical protein n=1 Tax=Leeuwenhoekiella sp. A16 TaxID=3141462 RepID=UPI003A8010F5